MAGSDRRLSVEALGHGLTATCQEMQARGLAPAQMASVQAAAATAIHEDPADCTYVHLDDVEVKKQKAQRDCNRSAGAEPAPAEAPPRWPASRQRRKVVTTVARLERGMCP